MRFKIFRTEKMKIASRTHPQLSYATLVALSKPRTFRNKLNESMSFVLLDSVLRGWKNCVQQ